MGAKCSDCFSEFTTSIRVVPILMVLQKNETLSRGTIFGKYGIQYITEIHTPSRVLKLEFEDTFSTHKNPFSASMESLSPQVVSAAKLPILNPNEFDLWKMKIEQYFLITDYSLWEVILNSDSPVPTRVVDGVLQPVTLTTAEQRLARKNELKTRGSLLMALPDKHQV
nr:ribonuclease H-like domain-containing protein [Tanacetum cinerariifolium]